MSRHFLVVLDPISKAQPALERAAWLAQHTGATLELFICDYEQELVASPLFGAAALECARRRLLATHTRTLKDHARRLARRGIKALVDARWEHPRDAGIVRKAIESNADLVIKHTHFHRELGRALFSCTDWSLIRTCPAKLWLVKPRPMSEPPSIVAAVDPMHACGTSAPLDDLILSAAGELRAATAADLRVLHAYDVAPALAVSGSSSSAPISTLRDVTAALKRRHDEATYALTDRHLVARERVHIHEGSVRQLLVGVTEHTNADVVVIGGVSRSGLPRAFIGSTAEHVLDRLPCDLLIIGPGNLATLH